MSCLFPLLSAPVGLRCGADCPLDIGVDGHTATMVLPVAKVINRTNSTTIAVL